MFQYALAYSMALKYRSRLLLDMSLFDLKEKKPGHTPREFELDIFEADHSTASPEEINYFEQLSLLHKIRRELHLNYPKMCYERGYSFDQKVKNAHSPVFFRGFFQSYKYFTDCEDEIRKLFIFPHDKLDKINRGLLERIVTTTSVSVHVRRGDYVEDKITNKVHGTCSREYYESAIEEISKTDEASEFFFFSDDIEWVEKEFRGLAVKKTFVNSNIGSNSWKDMLLMSRCSHNIIANSSFSWWGAWLNKSQSKKVIAPKRWFRDPEKERYAYDLIPEEWIRI